MYCFNCKNNSPEEFTFCKFCGKELKPLYHCRAVDIVDGVLKIPPDIAYHCTNSSIFINVNHKNTQFSGTTDKASFIFQVEELLLQYPLLSPFDFQSIYNPMVDNICRARKILIDSVLPVDVIGNPNEKKEIINLMGEALDIQTGRDLKVIDTKNSDRLIQRLENMHIPKNILGDYKLIHKFYNATKHGNKREHLKILSKIASSEGRLMAVQYYEYVRRIFIWYYQSHSLPVGNELSTIDYSKYGITKI